MRETLKKLLVAYGATGREDKVREIIREMVMPFVDTVEEDAMGNLICTRKGEGARVMLAAHMDHIGFVVLDIDEKGFLRVQNVGGIRRNYSLNRHVVFENGVHGVVSYEVDGFNETDRSLSQIFIDIGAKDRAEAQAKVAIGDVAVYVSDVFELGEVLMAAPAMDNRVGCAVLVEALKLLSNDCPNEVVAVFTVQEEVGLRGARAAAYTVNPDIGIALDVTLSGDTPKGYKFPMTLGKGPCVKILDSSVICNPRVVALMEDAAERAGIAYQREVLSGGGTDAGAMQQVRGGVPCGVISIACRYVHSACETISVSDAVKSAELLAAILNNKIEM